MPQSSRGYTQELLLKLCQLVDQASALSSEVGSARWAEV